MIKSTTALLVGALLAACFLSGCVSHQIPDRRELAEMVQSGPGGRTGGDAQEENYVVVGDGVAVADNLNPEDLTLAPQIVDIDGTIEMPFLGSLHVAGMTQKELEAELTKRYAPYYEGGADDLDIKVRITSRAKFFYVFGEVREAGRRVLSEETTVMDAVMGASPLSDSANLGSCRLIRGDPLDPLVILINVHQIVTEGSTAFNLTVREKDIIYVPPTWLAEVGYFLRRVFFPIEQIFGVILSSFNSYNYITDEDYRNGGGRVIF